MKRGYFGDVRNVRGSLEAPQAIFIALVGVLALQDHTLYLQIWRRRPLHTPLIASSARRATNDYMYVMSAILAWIDPCGDREARLLRLPPVSRVSASGTALSNRLCLKSEVGVEYI